MDEDDWEELNELALGVVDTLLFNIEGLDSASVISARLQEFYVQKNIGSKVYCMKKLMDLRTKWATPPSQPT